VEEAVAISEEGDDDRLARALARRRHQIEESRRSSAAFAEFAFRAEKTGAEIVNAPFHVEWHDALCTKKRLVIEAPVGHAKTSVVAIWLVWLLGKFPELRILYTSGAEAQSAKVLSHVKAAIEDNPRVREVFPHLRKSQRKGDPWHDTAITIDRRSGIRDPSMVAIARQSKRILGSRADVVVEDDLLNFENTRTPEQVELTLEWADNTVRTRLEPDGWHVSIGTPWVPGDRLDRLSRRPGYTHLRYSAVLNPEEPHERWRLLWPQRLTLAEIIEIEATTTPVAFARSYLCLRRIDSDSRFKEEWFTRCTRRGMRMLERAPRIGLNGALMPSFCGLDLAAGKKHTNAQTVFFVIGMVPNPREGGQPFRRILAIEAGRWTQPEILDRMGDIYQRYGCTFVVESNGVQLWMTEFGQARGMPVIPFNTDPRHKFSEAFGIESLGVELRSGLWQIPADGAGNHPEPVRIWKQQALFYSPNAHTGDYLMSSWFAREGARMSLAGPPSEVLDTLSR